MVDDRRAAADDRGAYVHRWWVNCTNTALTRMASIRCWEVSGLWAGDGRQEDICRRMRLMPGVRYITAVGCETALGT